MALYRKTGGNVWRYKFKRDGRTIRGTTGETSKRKAAGFLRKAKAQYDAGLKPQTAKGLGLSDLWPLEEARIRAEKLGTRRINDMLNCFRHLVDYFGADRALPDLNDYDAVMGYIDHRRRMVTRFGEPTRGQTIYREVALLRRTLTIAARQRPVPWVSHVVEFPKVKRGAGEGYSKKNETLRSKPHSREAILKVMAALGERIREHVTVHLLTGLRREELAKLTIHWKQTSAEGDVLLVVPDWAAKNGDERVLPVPARVLEIIDRRHAERLEPEPTVCLVPGCGLPVAYRGICNQHRQPGAPRKYAEGLAYRLPPRGRRKRLGPNDPLFSDTRVDRALREACRRVGYEKNVTMRDLRAWCATIGDWKTGDRRATMEVLGHSRPQTTERYLSAQMPRRRAHLNAVEEYLFGLGSDSEPVAAISPSVASGNTDDDF